MYVKLATVSAIIAVLTGAYFIGQSNGYDKRSAEYAVAALEEQARQDEANKAAQEASQERENKLLIEIARLRKLSRKLIDEAYQDPDANRHSLGTGSVQRLNRLNETTKPQ
jgi:hypothetical protein